MARKFAGEHAFLNSPGRLTPGLAFDTRNGLKTVWASFTATGTEAVADDWVIGEVHPGDRVIGIMVNTSVSLVTSTLALGIEGSIAKFGAASTFVTPGTPVFKALTTAYPPVVAPLQSVEPLRRRLLATLGVAALPAGAVINIVTLVQCADVA